MISWEEYSGRGDPRERWRIYRVRDGGDPELVATTDCPEGVGVAVCTLGSEGEFDDAACGILDALVDPEKVTGSWVLAPWCASPRELSVAGRLLGKESGRRRAQR